MTASALTWVQLTFTCDDWRSAEHAAVTVLGPQLAAAQDAGDLASWWFIRKGPQWHVRLESPRDDLTAHLASALTASGEARSVTGGVYEPETTRFGGPDGMDAAHRIFAADSSSLLDLPSRDRPPAAPRAPARPGHPAAPRRAAGLVRAGRHAGSR